MKAQYDIWLLDMSGETWYMVADDESISKALIDAHKDGYMVQSIDVRYNEP